MASRRAGPATQSGLEAARHLCQEARAVLTSLRGGPPAVARGYLAQDLMDLRAVVKLHLETNQPPEPVIDKMPATIQEDRPVTPDSTTEPPSEEDDGAVIVQRSHAQMTTPESPMPVSKICNFSVDRSPFGTTRNNAQPNQSPENVRMFARPFLAVVMDPRAAGPHTLVALRALFRLLERGSLVKPSSTKHGYHVSLEPLMKGVLACKFEQTDAGADEAVEMAIADLLALLVTIDHRAFLPATLMEAFNTVFVTRNTFVHSPALCYHFEDVLASMVVSSFEDISFNDDAACLILEFLVNQLLHTPLVGGVNLDDAGREAKVAHDATRVLCLRLTRCCLRTGWGHRKDIPGEEPRPVSLHHPWEDRSLLNIIQDDLCLSLLMTGQAIWAYQDSSSIISPGLISLDVLSEICATLSTLWNTVSLRRYLIPQFEQIFTGFYQRALVLLRKRNSPIDSASFNENLLFDSEVEIILESLVDLLGLHEPGHTSYSGDAGALEALFSTYDCHMSRSDVASELVVELCRCCGGVINDEGDVMLGVFSNPSPNPDDARPETPATGETDISQHSVYIKHWRQVPAYIKELCAEALVGSMKCLFDEEKAGRNDIAAQSAGGDTPEVKKGASDVDTPQEESSLRTIQSKKRLMRRAAKLFNDKSKKGIEFLVTSGLVPEPVTPKSVALFLRNGLVVGLNKVAVGMYLGEIGKAAEAGKSPLIWERDWFHKEVLSEYCSLFRFEGQSLLDGLRMFLAAFRLPGESQQIDRIIQAFADSCGQLCDESARLKLFSDDPKRASDPAFLLAFSIIMLNTDLHNKNIREDRKMSLEAFLRNNTDYGRDITEEGKQLPADFLTSIYERIKDEEIRTEGEGADGHMTVERWKDVLRGSAGDEPTIVSSTAPAVYDEGEVNALIVENLWMPIVSVIGSFWGVVGIDEAALEFTSPPRGGDGQNSMIGAQGARLGMDMALDMLTGVLNMGRLDIFQQIFKCVCYYTGLLGEYTSDAVDRTWTFVNSVEAQSAVVTVLSAARTAGDSIGVEGWTQVWGIMFELRDLKLLGGGAANIRRSILSETDPDLLLEETRREWIMYLAKGGVDGARESRDKSKGVTSVLGVMGRALFGSEETHARDASRAGDIAAVEHVVHTIHGKENLVIWNELAPSDDEDDETVDDESGDTSPTRPSSAGAQFESQLIHEAFIHDQTDMPVTVTGLERMEDTERFQISPRARVRKRLLRASDFAGLVSESRFMDLKGVQDMLSALADIVDKAEKSGVPASPATSTGKDGDVEGVLIDGTLSTNDGFAISPASEAFAEVLICEIALKNRDRLGVIWQNVLKEHYQRRLRQSNLSSLSSSESGIPSMHSFPSPGIEKCVTGLLRICICAVMRENIGNDVLGSLTLLCVPPTIVEEHLGKHNAEGLWRICRNIEGLSRLNNEGWEALLVLAEWCAAVGGLAGPRAVGSGRSRNGLAQDDPALQSYRSLHLLLHAPELSNVVPFTAMRSIRAVIIAGERARFSKLSIAGLDLLLVLHTQVESRTQPSAQESDVVWATCWIPVLDAIAEAGRLSMYPVSTVERGLELRLIC
jgi:hypothetical protein